MVLQNLSLGFENKWKIYPDENAMQSSLLRQSVWQFSKHYTLFFLLLCFFSKQAPFPGLFNFRASIYSEFLTPPPQDAKRAITVAECKNYLWSLQSYPELLKYFVKFSTVIPLVTVKYYTIDKTELIYT